jgi:tetratricopeptide (TPR) repeat protein
MKKFIILLCAYAMAINLFAGEIEDKERSTIKNSLNLLYGEQFEDALAGFTFLKDSYPDYPIGDFFLGFYYNFLSSYYETDFFDSKIVLHYDLSEKKADFHLNFNKKDPWINFYKGASMVNRGYLLGRDGKRFAGIRKTYNGISYIENCLKYDKNHGDALLLLGSYKFYKSSVLSWIYDKREQALKEIKTSISSSEFSKFVALSTIGWMYIDYEKPFEAEKIADEALKYYPGLHTVKFLKARALFEQKKHSEAIEAYLDIENRLNSIQNTYSKIDLFNTYYFLCLSYKAEGSFQNSDKYLDLALFSNLNIRERELLSERIKELENIRKLKNR